MAAILRIKRKKDDDPLDALLISCKRPKVEFEEPSASHFTPVTAIVKFAGTVEKQDDNVVEHITKTLSKSILKNNFKQHIVDVSKKARERRLKDSNESRYKIINSIRSLNTSKLEDLDENVVNIVDIEDSQNVSDQKSDSDYVYDLYYTETKEEIQIENLMYIQPIEDDLVFEEYFKDYEKNIQDESDDSNAESNWRNDYPDSDHSEDFIGEKDMMDAMKNLDLDELSDDSEDLVYGLDEDDVNRYGYQYAAYKARMKRQNKAYESYKNLCNDDGDDNDDDDLSDDSKSSDSNSSHSDDLIDIH